jgi:protocatechuate 3,4-dioxygenase alpha subunit
MTTKETPRPATTSQTVGPYFRLGLDALNCRDLAPPGTPGERISIQGRVLDGDGVGVPDAMLEIWQADSYGKYAYRDQLSEAASGEKSLHSAFRGFGRIPTDDQGRFSFSTIKPGPVPGPAGKQQAPHLVVSVFMRGLLIRLVTRIYFAGHPLNAQDPILLLVKSERRATLLAAPAAGRADVLEWNVMLQGQGETVFFEF